MTIIIKSDDEVKIMREAGQIVGQTLQQIREMVQPGINILEIESSRNDIVAEAETIEIQTPDDKFNFGFSISNIGPKIDFVDVDQSDPSPTNMRLGIFAQLYNDGHNKINFLFDANKLLVFISV